jgi:hemolysin III
MSHSRMYTVAEEVANAATHGVGLVLSLVAVPVLILTTAGRHDWLQVMGMSVFGATMIAVYTTSTLYHAVPHAEAKRRLRVADHIAIYLLIAGTYTPFTLGVLRGVWGWSLLGVLWTLALVGVAFKLTLGMRFPRASTAFYVAMGWMCIVAIKPMMTHIPGAGLFWLVAGGLCYTLGVPFYMMKGRRFTHAVWHVFVLGGSACHFWSVLHYAAPQA